MNTSEENLKWKSRAVDLMLEIDRIRDTMEDERDMTSAIVNTLANAVKADLCFLCLRDDDTGEVQLRAIIDRAEFFNTATESHLRDIAKRAAEQEGSIFLDSELTLTDDRVIYCLAAPLRVGKDSLGALLLLKTDRPFNSGEHDIIIAAVSQIDSAMQHLRTLRELRSRQKELEAIYRIDRIRDKNMEFQAMLDAVLREVCNAIETEIGFLMLFDKSGDELELRAATDYDLFKTSDHARLIREVSEEAIRLAQPINRAYAGGIIRSVIGVPLILRDKLIGVLGVVNRKGRLAFTRADLQLLLAISSQTDTAIFESLQTQRLREAFGKCVGPQVMERLLTIADRDLLSSERLAVTVLFSDIRGFTRMSEKIDTELLRSVLNDHLSTMTDIVLNFEGTLDKYIGDAVMCFFNAPERQSDHAIRAVRLSLEMQKAHHRIIENWRGRVSLPPIGIGIATGLAILGNFGSLRRLEYTAIGPDVNLASRLCSAAAGDQILISNATYEAVRDQVLADEMKPIHLKGIEENVQCWNLRGLKHG